MSEGRFFRQARPGSTSPAAPTVATSPSFAYTTSFDSRMRYDCETRGDQLGDLV